VPYVGIQFAAIPEFAGIATEVSQEFSAAYAGQQTVEEALAKSSGDHQRSHGSRWLPLSFGTDRKAAFAVAFRPLLSAKFKDKQVQRALRLNERICVMATQHSRSAARIMMAPAVIPASGLDAGSPVMTLWFSVPRLSCRFAAATRALSASTTIVRFVSSSAFWPAVQTTLIIVGGVLVITVIFGVFLAMLLDQPMWGQGVVRILVIAPFFVMPTVSALVWKNMFMDPVNGVFAHLWRAFGADPVVWLSDVPMLSIILIVSWQWLPFATLILLTAFQSLDSEQLEAAEMDGASPVARFFSSSLPHLSRAITIVILIQTIFLLAIFAEIFVTTGGAFGTRTLTYLIFQRVLESQNVGLGSQAASTPSSSPISLRSS
jgi:sorbitol/mannitol transport system permease protein